jgi:hypothetical protein
MKKQLIFLQINAINQPTSLYQVYKIVNLHHKPNNY